MDIGIFLSECLKKEVSGLYWSVETTAPNYIYYGRPVINQKDSLESFCTSWIMGTVVSKIEDQTIKEDGLVKLFTVWKNSKGIEPDFSWLEKYKEEE